MKILGVKISEVSLVEARDKVREFLNSNSQYKIFTPNPEMLVKADKDEYFRQVLNSGDLNICDGNGIVLASRLSSRATTEEPLKTIHGSDFALDICKIAEEEGKSIYLLGSGSTKVVKKTAKELKKRFKNLKIVGFDPGPKITEDNNQIKIENNNGTLQIINQKKPDILFVAFSFSKQEKWISENLSKLPSIKIAMGVGGTFDFLSGKIKRAPKIVRVIWMEWFWRLIQEPKRLGRIYNATIKFLYLIIKNK